MNTGAANAKRILSVSSWEVMKKFLARNVRVTRLNASCPLAVLKVAVIIPHLPPHPVAHPVQAVIVALAIENRVEHKMVETFIFESLTIWSSIGENLIQ